MSDMSGLNNVTEEDLAKAMRNPNEEESQHLLVGLKEIVLPKLEEEFDTGL